jgi:hypothetical protein
MCLWVGYGKLLLGLASTVILGSEFGGTHDHILLCCDSGSRAALSLCIFSCSTFVSFSLDCYKTLGSIIPQLTNVKHSLTNQHKIPFFLCTKNHKFEEYHLLECDAVSSDKTLMAFRRNFEEFRQ